jgi:UDP-glucose 4-epimerase
MARIIIAGASGLTGLALTRLLSHEHEVVAVARRAGPDDLKKSVQWVEADVGKADWVSSLPAKYDAVYALFQSPDFRDFPGSASAVFNTNVAGLQALLDHAPAAGAGRFVFTSTGGLYASSPRPLTEDMPLATAGPLGYYLSTKRCGELLVEAYANLMSTLVVRPFFIYGPEQAAGMLMPRLVQSVRDGKGIGLQGENGLEINPIHVDDSARLLARALSAEHKGIVNLAGPQRISLRQIGETIGNAIGKQPVFDLVPNSTAPVVVSDNSRMVTMLGNPEISAEMGIAAMCRNP